MFSVSALTSSYNRLTALVSTELSVNDFDTQVIQFVHVESDSWAVLFKVVLQLPFNVMVIAYVSTMNSPALSFVNAGPELLWHEDDVNLVMYLVIGRVPSFFFLRSYVE